MFEIKFPLRVSEYLDIIPSDTRRVSESSILTNYHKDIKLKEAEILKFEREVSEFKLSSDPSTPSKRIIKLKQDISFLNKELSDLRNVKGRYKEELISTKDTTLEQRRKEFAGKGSRTGIRAVQDVKKDTQQQINRITFEIDGVINSKVTKENELLRLQDSYNDRDVAASNYQFYKIKLSSLHEEIRVLNKKIFDFQSITNNNPSDFLERFLDFGIANIEGILNLHKKHNFIPAVKWAGIIVAVTEAYKTFFTGGYVDLLSFDAKELFCECLQQLTSKFMEQNEKN